MPLVCMWKKSNKVHYIRNVVFLVLKVSKRDRWSEVMRGTVKQILTMQGNGNDGAKQLEVFIVQSKRDRVSHPSLPESTAPLCSLKPTARDGCGITGISIRSRNPSAFMLRHSGGEKKRVLQKAAGMNDFLWLSVMHRSVLTRPLQVFRYCSIVLRRAWELLSVMSSSLCNFLLSDTFSKRWRSDNPNITASMNFHQSS